MGMPLKLKDKANSNNEADTEQKKKLTETEEISTYLTQKAALTDDVNLKYDITKCLEIIQGKENQEVLDMKQELLSLLEENEKLFKENCELVCELEQVRER